MTKPFPGRLAATDQRVIGLRWIVTTIAMVAVAVALLVLAPSTVIAIPFNLLVTLFLVLAGAIVLPLAFVWPGEDGVSDSRRTVRGVTPQTDLEVDPEKGLISHGNMRHVLFRIGTIQEILVAADPDRLKGRDAATLLFDTGRRMGDGFGGEFVMHLHAKKLALHPNLDEMIEQWCDFDVSGGWGKWHPTRLNDEFTGRIQIKYNYLTARADPPVLEGRSLCKLLEGYISGVLQVLARTANPGKNWHAVVNEIPPCGIHSDGKKPCEFNFKLTALDS